MVKSNQTNSLVIGTIGLSEPYFLYWPITGIFQRFKGDKEKRKKHSFFKGSNDSFCLLFYF